MKPQELRIITAVAIMSGTLVIGLDQFSPQPIGNRVRVAQTSNVPSSNSNVRQGDYGTGPSWSGAVDAMDTSRMDTRQSRGLAGPAGDMSRTGNSGSLRLGPTDYDSRRDNSRLDTRQERAAPAGSSTLRDERR